MIIIFVLKNYLIQINFTIRLVAKNESSLILQPLPINCVSTASNMERATLVLIKLKLVDKYIFA